MGASDKGVRLATYSETKALNPNGRMKLRCPNCGSISFVPYIFSDSGAAVDLQECGRCDHQESCNYHMPPSEYFRMYPERRPGSKMTQEERREQWAKRQAELRYEQQKKAISKIMADTDVEPENNPDTGVIRHDSTLVSKAEAYAENTPFFRFLCKHFDPETVRNVFRLYHVGGDKTGRTIYWQIDQAGAVHAGKVMKYADNGHRAKNPDGTPVKGGQDWVHSILRRSGKMSQDGTLEQCLFGLHLLNADDMPAPVCLVEAEKSAIICACEMPQFIWIATGGKYNLKAETLEPLIEYSKRAGAVAVFPDLGSFDDWAAKLEPLKDLFPFVFSDFVEKNATDKAREKGMDIADLILGEF